MLKKENIFKKFFIFIKRFFSKDDLKALNPVEPTIKTNNFINEFEHSRKILSLQKDFEVGIVKEEDLTEEEKSNLMNLYRKQIEDLNKDISSYQRALKMYDEKIAVVQAKLQSLD